MSDAVRPSWDESKHYYDGLPSGPLLVARTSTTPFPPVPPELTPLERNQRAFPYVTEWAPGTLQKSLGPIGRAADLEEQHTMVRVWCPALRDALVAALDGSPLAACWSTLYTVRVASTWRRAPDRVQPTSAVVLLVGIDAAGRRSSRVPRWEEALQAARACRDVLLAWTVQDVEVEVLTNGVVGLEGDGSHNSRRSTTAVLEGNGGKWSHGQARRGSEHTTTLDAVVDLDYETDPILARFASLRHTVEGDSIHAFLDYPGQRLERTVPTDQGRRPSGTWSSLGVYVGLGGGPDVYAVTSRHVSKDVRLPSDQIPVLCGTQESLANYVRLLRRQASEVQATIESLAERFLHLQESMTESADGASAEEVKQIEKQMHQIAENRDARTTFVNSYLPRLIDALEALATHAPTDGNTDALPLQRLLGCVAASAPHGLSRQGAWNDWALVRLSDERRAIVQGHKPANAVLINSVPKYTETLRAIVPHPSLFLAETNASLPIKAPLPPAADTARPGPREDRHPRWVLKRGAKTGLTYGLAVEIEAVVRRPRSDGTLVVASALLVLDHRGENHAFSRPGDAGSAVLDTQGHVVGLVDAGVGSNVGAGEHERLLRLFHRPGDGGIPSVYTARSRTAEQGFGVTRCPDGTLVTPIESVFDSIEEVTGTRPVVL